MREDLRISKTLELRKVIKSLLLQFNKNVFYENADDDARYPYIVYELDSVDFNNTYRDDLILTISIWDKGTSTKTVETIADNIERLDCINNPTDTVLPTFYKISRSSIPDEDKSIKRRELKFSIQNYYIGE